MHGLGVWILFHSQEMSDKCVMLMNALKNFTRPIAEIISKKKGHLNIL